MVPVNNCRRGSQLFRQSLGEMATIIPVTGSFTEYAERFIDDALAFALGWAYWYLWVTVSHLRLGLAIS